MNTWATASTATPMNTWWEKPDPAPRCEVDERLRDSQVDALAVDDLEAEPAEDGSGGDREDERRQPDVGDEHPVGEPEQGADRDREEDRDDPVQPRPLRREEHDNQHGAQAREPADREVVVVHRQDDGDAERDDHQGNGVAEDPLERQRGEERAGPQDAEGGERGQDRERDPKRAACRRRASGSGDRPSCRLFRGR